MPTYTYTHIYYFLAVFDLWQEGIHTCVWVCVCMSVCVCVAMVIGGEDQGSSHTRREAWRTQVALLGLLAIQAQGLPAKREHSERKEGIWEYAPSIQVGLRILAQLPLCSPLKLISVSLLDLWWRCQMQRKAVCCKMLKESAVRSCVAWL